MNEEKDKNIEKLDVILIKDKEIIIKKKKKKKKKKKNKIKNFHPMIMLLTICNLRKEKSNGSYLKNFTQ